MSEEKIEEEDEYPTGLELVDACMRKLGSSLNLLDPDGTFKGVPSEEVLLKIMKAVYQDYRKLSHAILALREEE